MPKITVLIGIPCSGKSTWARNMQKYPSIRTISRDTIRANCFTQPYQYNLINEELVTRIHDTAFHYSVEKKEDIILDNTHCKEAYLNEIIKTKPTGYSLQFVYFDCPLWKAYYRNVVRYLKTGKWIPFKIIKQMKKNYDKINKKKYEQYLV